VFLALSELNKQQYKHTFFLTLSSLNSIDNKELDHPLLYIR